MRRSLLAPFIAAAALALGSCGWLGKDREDETVGWSAQKLYAEAKDQMSSKNWDKAIKYLEKLEARYPYGRFAQQRTGRLASALPRSPPRTASSSSTPTTRTSTTSTT
jgi:outer membrane protein assembly factor BamD